MRILTATARRALHEFYRQWLLLVSSGALAITGAATAVFGFLFWWFAARYFPPYSVGLAAAAISIMNLMALMGEFGLGTLLMGESLRRAREAPGLIPAALFAVLVSSTLFGVVCLLLASVSPLRLGSFFSSTDHRVLFIAGCAITGFTLVLDGAFVGLLQSSLRMYRNVAFSAFKLALLPLLAYAAPTWPLEVTIFLAWVLGKLLSVLLLVPFLAYRGHAAWSAPDFVALGRQGPSVLGHYLLDLVTQGPGLILPFLVTVLFAADVNAAFYAAWMIFSVVMLVSASLTTMLFAIGSMEPATIASRMRFSLWLCALASLVAGVGLFFLSGWILRWFGSSYAAVGGPMLQILGLAVLAMALKHHYIAVQRLRGRMARAAMLLGAGGLLELALAIWGAKLGGPSGFALGWVGAVYLEAAFVAPLVLRTARGDRALEARTAAPNHLPPVAFEPIRHLAGSGYGPRPRRARAFLKRRA